MNAKPIFIIRFPYSEGNTTHYDSAYKMVTDRLIDYHVLYLMDNIVEKVEFEVFNSTNATDKDIEELKTTLLKSFSNLENESLDKVTKTIVNNIKNFDK
jgi:hypothetical protein